MLQNRWRLSIFNCFAGYALFAKISDNELRELAEYLKPNVYPPNHTIFWLGDPGTDFCIIHRGRVDLLIQDEAGKESLLASLKAGQFFGELSLLDGGRRTATARCGEETELLCLGREDFEKFIRSHADAAFGVMIVLGQRQRNMVDKVRGIKNVNEVVAEESSRWHIVSDTVAGVMSSPYFLIGQLVLIVSWVIINHVQHGSAFDSYPYSLLSLVFSVQAMVLSLFVLVSQGRQGDATACGPIWIIR